ncbi:secreted protein [Candidatus Magnetomorum sp. HK-1]|nr:secreted protein [Candidatus Magnetomorum sp. HK-1]
MQTISKIIFSLLLMVQITSFAFADADPANPAKTQKPCGFTDDMNCFENRQVADADEINANFKALLNRIDNIYSVNGNIGINTTNPLQKLEVSGDTFLNGNTKTNYLVINKQNSSGEGGELVLKGSNGHNDLAIDNLNGNCRVFGFDEGKYFEIFQGSLIVGNDTKIYRNLDVSMDAYLHKTTYAHHIILTKQGDSGEGGELRLQGSNGYSDLAIDNFYGHCRVFGFGEGKLFEIHNG